MSRIFAVIALLVGAGFAQDVDPWVTRLASKKYEIREAAKQALVEMGLDCLPIVTAVLRSGDHDACRNARDALGRLGPVVIPYLLENLEGNHADTRYYSITVLGDLAPDSARAVPWLAKALRDADDEIVYEAAWALAALREHSAPAVDDLAAALTHDEPLVRTTAAGALAAIGSAARDATPALLAALDDKDAPARRAAAEALAAIGLEDAGAVPRLVSALSDENVYVRMSAARALGSAGPKAERGIAALRSALRDPAVAPDAAWALERITGRPTSETTPTLEAIETESEGEAETPGWRMLGGNPQRNAVAPAANIPRDWDIESNRHILWSVRLGHSAFAGPVAADGRVFIGAGNEVRQRPNITEPCGTLLCLRANDGELLWQDHAPKLGRQADFLLPTTTSTPFLEADRIYYVTAQCQVRCLDVAGFRDGTNDGPYVEEDDTTETAADRIWELDMASALGVFPHEASNCSVISAGPVLLVCTSNGVDEAHTRVPSPRAPSFIGVNKNDGTLLWACTGPGDAILHGQWSSPSLGRVDDRTLAFFGGGDGWLYAIEPHTGRVVWRFDGNAKGAVWKTGSDFAQEVRRNSIIACPLVADERVYLALGQDPEHGRGNAVLHAIDPRGEGDVSASRRIWSYHEIGRMIATPIAHHGLLFAADLNGRIHCIEARTGRRLWMHDTLAPIWGSVLVLGDRLLAGNEDGILLELQAGPAKKLLREIELPAPIYAGPAVFDDTLYVATAERLYAIGHRDEMDQQGQGETRRREGAALADPEHDSNDPIPQQSSESGVP